MLEINDFKFKILPHKELINTLFPIKQITSFSTLNNRANLMVQNGCNNYCTYCIIPYARGKETSENFTELLKSATLMSENSIQEIIITGINVGAYSYEGKTLADLIIELSNLKNIQRIRLSSIEVNHLTPQLIDCFKHTPKLMSHLHIPLQSGSDKILKQMNRKYDSAFFVDKINQLKNQIPNLKISTDILVGFPDETDNDFKDTINIINQCNFSHLHCFKYSKRENTPAANFANQVSDEQKSFRMETLQTLSSSLQKNHLQQKVGQTCEVLFDTFKNGQNTGYNEHYELVSISCEKTLRNTFRSVSIKNVLNEQLLGDLLN